MRLSSGSENLSYSLYLWNMPFASPNVSSWATTFPQNVFLTLLAATISFYAVEQPVRKMMATRSRWKQKSFELAPRESPEAAAVGATAKVSEDAVFSPTAVG